MRNNITSAWPPHHIDGFTASPLQLTSKLRKPNLPHAALMFTRFASANSRLLHAQVAGPTSFDDFPSRDYQPTFNPELD